MQNNYNAVLFDLDGTLIDTAPDMVAVLQDLQREHGVLPVDYDTGRSYVSNGSLGLVRLGFGELEQARERELQQDYLARYARRLAVDSRVFSGVDTLLDTLDGASRPWGVVTNKPAFLTDPLMQALDLADRSAATVSGDTLPVRKPDPAPLLHACEIAGIRPEQTIYVGDADRDIEAGRRAGMLTVGVGYGYITADDDPQRWNADELVADTAELSQIITKVFKL
ncbi:MAG: HAD-IA family hydrolase [Pseudomonadota bacterium]